ncbi:MAG TPA: CD225/dispanin family protein [Fimbriimonadaceae bacterium]|jgi:hypothetical protein
MDNTPGAKLKELVAQHGQSLVYDADKTQQLLSEACPNNTSEVQALVTAQRLSIPWELLNAGPRTDESFFNRLVDTLEKGGPMSADAARWILQTWGDVLGVTIPTPTASAAAPTAAPGPQAAPANPAAGTPTAAAATGASAGPAMYFILDGTNRFGPADAATLTQWSAEGRLHDNMRFEEQGTGKVLLARDVPGLFLTGAPQGQVGQPGPGLRPEQPYQQQGNPYQQPPGQGQYYRQAGYSAINPQLQKSGTNAIIKAVVGTICCGCMPLGIVALIFAIMGKSKADQGLPDGESQIKTAHILGNISIGIGICIGIFYAVMFVIGASSGGVHYRTY